MNTLKVFNSSEFGDMRTCCDPKSGEVWFCLNDVCKALEIVNSSDVKSDLPDGVATIYPISDSLGRQQNATFINESGLYRIIFKSRKDKALQFQDWVCSEVLPSIRKHGAYITTDTLNNMLGDPNFAIRLFTEIKKEREEKERLQKEIDTNAPKVRLAEAVSASKSSILIGELALFITKNGYKIGEMTLFKWMREKGYLNKVGEMRNLPTQEYMERGYFDLKKTVYFDNKAMELKTKTTPMITEKGQKYFLEKFLKSA